MESVMDFNDLLVDGQDLLAEHFEELNKKFKNNKSGQPTDAGVVAGFGITNYVDGLKKILEARKLLHAIGQPYLYSEEE